MSRGGEDLPLKQKITSEYSFPVPPIAMFGPPPHLMTAPLTQALAQPPSGQQPYDMYCHNSGTLQDFTQPSYTSQLDSFPSHFNSLYPLPPDVTNGVPHSSMWTNSHVPHSMWTNSHQYMKQSNAPFIVPSTTTLQASIEPGGKAPFIKQEPGIISRDMNREPGIRSGEVPFIKQEPGIMSGEVPFIKQEPGIMSGEVPFIKQEPAIMSGEVPFIKQEPGVISGDVPFGVPFIKQEPGTVSGDVPFLKKEPANQNPCNYGQEDCGVSFPPEPLNLNFMSDIEDIVQPSPSEISINCIQKELSSFDGPSDNKQKRHRVGVVKEEADDEPPWEPPLWQQQYENIRSMRSKRDAPVDKYGCFMNAQKDVASEIRRYQVLISLMLSSQTKDEVVGKAMVKLKENGLTITNILATPQEEVAGMIFPVGFWNKKAEYIKKTTKILDEKFDGDIPNSVQGLVSLPGIGPKMAHLIMDFAWGEVSGISVDTHVHRITHRLGWMKREARNPEEARKHLEKWLPRSEWSDLNLLFVGFGQQICCPLTPKCSDCLNKDLCPSSSCLVSLGLPLGIGFQVSTKSKGKKAKSSTKTQPKKIKIEL